MEELTGVVTWENPLDTISKSVLRLLYENAEVFRRIPPYPRSPLRCSRVDTNFFLLFFQ